MIYLFPDFKTGKLKILLTAGPEGTIKEHIQALESVIKAIGGEKAKAVGDRRFEERGEQDVRAN